MSSYISRYSKATENDSKSSEEQFYLLQEQNIWGCIAQESETELPVCALYK